METLKREISRVAEAFCAVLGEIAELTGKHINGLPKTELWGEVDEASKKRSVASHYKFVSELAEKLVRMGKLRERLLQLSECLDEMSSRSEYELQTAILSEGQVLLELQRRGLEIENMSGRFLSGLDRLADATHKGERADFRAAGSLCREYFDFISKTGLYIDNLKKI